MNKGFLIKTAFLIFMLIVILFVMFFVRQFNFISKAADSEQSRTFFEQFIVSGGPIVWFILLPISLITVYLAVEHSITIRRKKLIPAEIGDKIVSQIRQSGIDQLESKIAQQNDFVSKAMLQAITKGKGDWFRMRSLLAESLQEQAMVLLRKIEWLNLIGNVSPMVGLFGTVFGMIKLFNAIVISGGQPQPAQLAGGISVALVTTLWGLFIAIPALAIHGIFRNRIETLVSQAVVESESIMPQIRQNLRLLQAEKYKQKQSANGIPRKAIEVRDYSPSR